MFRLKLIKKPILFKLKCNFSFPPIVLANLQEKEVTPTKEKQEIVPDKNYDGLSKVTVDKIPDEYIIPTGNIEITKNGIYNVREKETANVNIPMLKLGTKNITENGVYKASDDELDGYSEVTVGIKSLFTGHYDRQGLKQIGWSDEEIDYYQQYWVQWDSENDYIFKLTSDELLGNDTSTTRFIPKNTTKKSFSSYNSLLAIPLIDFSNITSFNSIFSACMSLIAIPLIDTSKGTSFNSTFSSCYNLIKIPLIDTSKGTSFNSTFSSCYNLKTIPLLDTSNGRNFQNMFSGCYSLNGIPLIDTSKGTSFNSTFRSCKSLKKVPLLNTSNAKNMSSMFDGCVILEEIPQFNTSKVQNFQSIFWSCPSLKTIPKMDFSSATNISSFCSSVSLTDFGGLENLGQAYSTTQSANYNNYKLDLSICTKLTEQSLINVLTNLYDIKTKGCKVQSVVLGATNLAKLTSTEGQQALSNSQAKGWNIS